MRNEDQHIINVQNSISDNGEAAVTKILCKRHDQANFKSVDQSFHDIVCFI